MSHLEIELKQLKRAILEMMRLANSQLEKSKAAFLEKDNEIAEEVMYHEKRMNAMELSIDRDCENIFALYQPVATDLRFVISMLKVNSDLERIADYACGLSEYVVNLQNPINKQALEKTRIGEMFDITMSMLTDIARALETEDTALARKVYKKDVELNTINKDASNIIRDLIINDPDSTRRYMLLFSAIRKLERVGDHIKNIAEDTIFYIDAIVLKHIAKNKRLSENEEN
jgi:phosphate transport system protein